MRMIYLLKTEEGGQLLSLIRFGRKAGLIKEIKWVLICLNSPPLYHIVMSR